MKASLKRLRQDYVDLYLIHWPNYRIPLKETIKALEFCVEEGYTKYIGVSNFSVDSIREAQKHLKEHQIIANQVEYSLLDQKPRTNLLPFLKSTNRTLIAYSPFARGILLKIRQQTLMDIAKKYMKTPAQVALNWVITQENVVAIPKSTNPIHLLELMDAINWKLKIEDSISLSQSFI
jgi:diketogulonate reductase-like aldo/keto reductase